MHETTFDSEEKYRREAEFIADRFEEKMLRVGKRVRFANDLLALYRYMMDPEVHWTRKSLVVAALVYFIIPFDTIPDFAPAIGFLDDIGIIAAAVTYLGSQLKAYYPGRTQVQAEGAELGG